jgi:hypothetical protein
MLIAQSGRDPSDPQFIFMYVIPDMRDALVPIPLFY